MADVALVAGQGLAPDRTRAGEASLMPEGWQPNVEAFLDGLQFGVYAALATLAALLAITAIRRVFEV